MENSDEHDPDVCATVGCDRSTTLTYLGRPRCQACYEDDVADGDATEQEIDMVKSKKKTARKSSKKATEARKGGTGSKAKAATPAPKSAVADKPKRLSAFDAAAQVLQTAGEPMGSKSLIAAMTEQGLWSSPNGKTPHATLYAAMLREINAKGSQARFRKADRGLFEYAGQG